MNLLSSGTLHIDKIDLFLLDARHKGLIDNDNKEL